VHQGWKYRGPGFITQGDLKVEVECEYEVSQVDGVTSWHGRFSGAKSTSEPEPGAAGLVAGGKSGAIIVVGNCCGNWFGAF
jgi:hypothetical protein